MRSLRWFIAISASLLIGMQLVTVERTNPVARSHFEAPEDVRWIVRRSCFDCHSNETRWPIWSYVAPMSWHVVSDVDRGRAALNFSDWEKYTPAERAALRTIINPVVAGHRMPLWYYLPLHPDARVSENDANVLARWSQLAVEELEVTP